MSRLAALFITLALLGLPCRPAAAHHVWILPTDAGVEAYFGEFAENLHEVSPGLLDRIEVTARVVSAKGETPLEAKRGAAAISLSGRAGPGDSILAEDARAPVRERKSADQTVTRAVYNPAARFITDLAPREPVLTLDIVPTGRAGQFKVVFRGAPLSKAKVEVMAASGWTRELRTDEAGMVEAEFPWKGAYAVEVSHADRTPGQRAGQAFDLTNFVTTLSLIQATGLDPLPPPPPAKPSRQQ